MSALMDLAPDFRRTVLKLVVSHIRTKALLLLGVQGVGKSPTLFALATALSRYYIERE